jgi:simple sugar transport system substrate-binding protein
MSAEISPPCCSTTSPSPPDRTGAARLGTPGPTRRRAGGASDVEDEACIDQQPYLQGYLSIDSLWLYHKNKSVIGAQQSVPTGPVVIGQSNIGNILDAVNAGLR